MKIIDNKKDYYDYLMGIYGIDTKIVYDRRGSMTFDYYLKRYCANDYKKLINRIDVKMGNLVYSIIKDEDTGKWGVPSEINIGSEWMPEMIPNPRRLTEEGLKSDFCVWGNYGRNIVTDGDKCPLMVKLYYKAPSYGYMENNCATEIIPNPILSTFPFIPEFIPATTVWDEIYNFISSKYDKPIIDTRTEKQRIESAGFDAKTSFRKM